MFKRIFGNLRASFRRRRYEQISDAFNLSDFQNMILDLGGGPASFFASQYPRTNHLVLLEIDESDAQLAKSKLPQLNVVIANGEEMPFADGAFELSVCNSVIEHVQNPPALATEIRRSSVQYFVQTPNGDFPIEPHSFIGIPFYQQLPMAARKLTCRVLGGDFEYIESVNYIPEPDLVEMFPDAQMVYEHALGMVKSYFIFKKG